jgi:hypothetical protein
MKLMIYSVAEKTPPLNERIIAWGTRTCPAGMNPDTLEYLGEDRICVCKVDEGDPVATQETIEQMEKDGIHTSLAWEGGGDLYLDDLWSYTVPSNGE